VWVAWYSKKKQKQNKQKKNTIYYGDKMSPRKCQYPKIFVPVGTLFGPVEEVFFFFFEM